MDALQLIEPPPRGKRPAGVPAMPAGRRTSGALADARLADSGHDPLTGLPNQSTIARHLEHELARAERDGELVAALYVDLDHFKHVNDALGHAAGDEALVHVAGRIRRATRGTELVARLGSDEFVHLCRVATPDAARATAAKLIEQLDAPLRVQDVEFQLGASIGIAIAPGHGRDARELLKHAHAAMYRAKHAGRCTWALYTDRDDEDSHRRLTLTARLRHALAGDELVLHYQPLYDVAAGTVHGVEALVRWQDPATGLVQPAAFIPHAEESRLITDIGAWVVDAVCRQAAAWRAQGIAPRISINASPRELRDAGYADRLAAALARHELAPRQFMIEVTESALVTPKGELPTLDALRQLGVVLAIDDFGTRSSSLARLRDLPVGVLKIDRAFLLDVPRDPQAAAIVEAIASLGRALDMDVVAVGIETPAQLELAERAGCRYAQGHHLAWPMPAAEMTARLEATRDAA